MAETSNATSSTESGPPDGTNGRAASRFSALFSEREPYLIRARRLSRLTIPYLYREIGANSTTNDVLPWQSLGGYGISNLGGKITQSMFPQGTSFVNIKQTKEEMAKVAQHFEMLVATQQMSPEDASTARGKINALTDQALSKVEMEFVDGMEEDGDRAVLFSTALHLLVGGNHALHFCPDGTLQEFKLERYVQVKDRRGNLLEFVIQEQMAYQSMPSDIQKICREKGYGPKDKDTGEMSREWDAIKNPIWTPIDVYTHGLLVNGRWVVYDEVYSTEVPGSRGTYDKDVLPYLFLGMIQLEGEPYARSYAETYEADLQSFDALYQGLTEAGLTIGQLKWGIKPGSSASKKQFAEAGNGDIITAEPEDIFAIKADKGGDMQVTYQLAEKYEKRLEFAFLLSQSIQRDAERVTAEEIKYMAQQLDATLGGVYSNQVVTWQMPYARLKMKALTKQKRMTDLPKGSTKVTVIAGEAGLGRMMKAQNLEEFLKEMAQIFPQQIGQYIYLGNVLSRGASNRSIDSDGLLKSDDQVKQEQQAAQQQALSQQVAPELVKQGGGMMQQAQQGQIDQAAQAQQQQPAPAQQGAQ